MHFLKKIAPSIVVGLLIGCLLGAGYWLNTGEEQYFEGEKEVVSVCKEEEPGAELIIYEIHDEPEPLFEVFHEELQDNFKMIESINLDQETQELVYSICNEYAVPFTLVLALIEHESRCNPNTISTTGDYGLCQINSINHGWLEEKHGITDIMDVEQNVTACCIILSDLFEKYEDEHKVLMAYNMGEGGAKKCWNAGEFSSKYSRTIISRKDEIENDRIDSIE